MSRSQTICVLSSERIQVRVLEARGHRRALVTSRVDEDFAMPMSLGAKHDPALLAGAIAEALREAGDGIGPVTLVVPLSWCFTHPLRRGRKRFHDKSWEYQLEEFLPLPLEKITCGLVRWADGRVLGVAVPTAPMKDLLDALSRRGIEVDHLTVDVIAAWAHSDIGESAGVLLLDERQGRFLGSSSDGSEILATTFSIATEEDVFHAWRSQRGDSVPPSWGEVLDLSADRNRTWSHDFNGVEIIRSGEAVDRIAERAVNSSPRFDLRNGDLASPGGWKQVPRLAAHCATALGLALIILIAGLHGGRMELQANRGALDEARLEVYRRVLDAEMLPPEAALRLASERKRLEALTLQRRESKTHEDEPSLPPLALLRDWTLHVPEDVRVLLTDASFDGRQITLRGQTGEHRDAERLAAALNQVAGVHAGAPRTRRMDSGGVEFSIVGEVGHER